MTSPYRRLVLLVVGAIAIAPLASSCSSADNAAPAGSSTAEVVQFTCCTKADVSPVRHRGETFTIHWIRTSQPAPAGQTSHPVVLSAALSVGYQDVNALKSAEGNAPSAQLKATPIHTTDRATTSPTSTITIPAGAHSGFYNLTTTVTSDGVTASGGTVIRVASR